jgi:hypothetical protein
MFKTPPLLLFFQFKEVLTMACASTDVGVRLGGYRGWAGVAEGAVTHCAGLADNGDQDSPEFERVAGLFHELLQLHLPMGYEDESAQVRMASLSLLAPIARAVSMLRGTTGGGYCVFFVLFLGVWGVFCMNGLTHHTSHGFAVTLPLQQRPAAERHLAARSRGPLGRVRSELRRAQGRVQRARRDGQRGCDGHGPALSARCWQRDGLGRRRRRRRGPDGAQPRVLGDGQRLRRARRAARKVACKGSFFFFFFFFFTCVCRNFFI